MRETGTRTAAPGGKKPAPSQQVASFIAKFDPAISRLLRAARAELRRRFPTAVELVYDNYNALAIGWGPNERASEAFVSLAGYARGVTLYFTRGKSLPDPEGLLEGAGNQGRFLRLTDVAQLAEPGVDALLGAAAAQGKNPLPTRGRGHTVIKSISAKQRPRRQ